MDRVIAAPRGSSLPPRPPRSACAMVTEGSIDYGCNPDPAAPGGAQEET